MLKTSNKSLLKRAGKQAFYPVERGSIPVERGHVQVERGSVPVHSSDSRLGGRVQSPVPPIPKSIRVHTDSLSTAVISLIFILFLSLSGCETETVSPVYNNTRPEILAVEKSPGDSLEIQGTLILICDAIDADGHPLEYLWSASAGEFLDDSKPETHWAAPRTAGLCQLSVTVSDPFADTTAFFDIVVLPRGATNQPPQIVRLTLDPDTLTPGDGLNATVQATDAEGDALSYIWTSQGGFFNPESGPQVRWFAPSELGEYYLKVTVIDSHHYTSDSLSVMVIPDTTVHYEADFSTDQVSGSWGTVGLLGGLGDSEGISQIAWDSGNEAMSVTSQTSYGTYAFRLIGRNFGEGTFSCTVSVPNAQYGRIAFIPKLIDRLNWVLIGVNPFQGSWQVLRSTAGTLQYLGEGWDAFDIQQPLRFTYIESENRGTAMVNGRILWQGAVTAEFQRNLPMGIGLYGLENSVPALYDNFRVTTP